MQYEGETNDEGEFHGVGLYRFVDGSEYRGRFEHDRMSGSGTYTHRNGDIYKGQFRNDRFEGYGVYIWVDGSRYKGQWKNDAMHGHGKQFDPHGRLVLKGVWENDVFQE